MPLFISFYMYSGLAMKDCAGRWESSHAQLLEFLIFMVAESRYPREVLLWSWMSERRVLW